MTSLQKNYTFLDTFSKSAYNQPMSAASYSCIFSSPKAETIFQEASLILLPGITGKVGVLPHHSPMVIMLQPGIAQVSKALLQPLEPQEQAEFMRLLRKLVQMDGIDPADPSAPG